MFLKTIKINKIITISTIILIILSLIILTIIKVQTKEVIAEPTEEKTFIKWVDFNVPLEIMEKTSKIDIDSHTKQEETKITWIQLLSYLATKYGFS